MERFKKDLEFYNYLAKNKMISDSEISQFKALSARSSISTLIGWLNVLKTQANEKGSLGFVKKAEQAISDLYETFNTFEDMEKNFRVSRQRNSDLEAKLIEVNEKNRQLMEVIKRHEENF